MDSGEEETKRRERDKSAAVEFITMVGNYLTQKEEFARTDLNVDQCPR